MFEYSFKFHKNNEVTSPDFDQSFYNNILTIRNSENKLVSLSSPYIMIAEDKSLEMEYVPSMLENNNFNKNAILIPGAMDIGQYVRTLDMAFHCRTENMEIKEGDIYAYCKFKTDKKIVFKRFYWTDEIAKEVSRPVNGIKTYRNKTYKSLLWYYEKQKKLGVKKRLLKLIKENLI